MPKKWHSSICCGNSRRGFLSSFVMFAVLTFVFSGSYLALWSSCRGGGSWLLCLFLVCIMCTVCLGLFALSFGQWSCWRLCSLTVSLPGHLYIIFRHFKHRVVEQLTLVMLNNLRCHAHFFPANQITWSGFLIKFTYLMTNNADPDQLAFSNWSGSILFAKTGKVVFSERRVKKSMIRSRVVRILKVNMVYHSKLP